MATTYALGGEFSSDEEIDRIEQQSERLAQAKFNDDSSFQQYKPTKSQVDEAIATIRKLPIDSDVAISDEMIAALLDHLKIPRGPIVDSTRRLYKKIVIRSVRGDRESPQPTLSASTNGDKHVVNNNNNSINNGDVIQGKPSKNNGNVEQTYGSSDEDEPMPPISSQSSAEENIRNRLLEAVTLSSQPKSGSQRQVEPMEVDPDAPAAGIRDRKQDLDDESESSTSSSSSSSSDEGGSASEDKSATGAKLDIEPASVLQSLRKASTPKASVAKSSGARRTNSHDLKPQGIAKRRPNTRSQGVAARLSFPKSGARSLTDTSNISEPAIHPDSITALRETQKSKSFSKYAIAAVFAALFAFLFYHFKSDLTKSTDRLLSSTIKFS